MLVTFLNNLDYALYVSNLRVAIPAGGTVQCQRSTAEIDSDQGLKKLVADGSLTLTFEEEDGDSAASGFGFVPKVYSNGTRPDPDDVPPYTIIFNSDDLGYNVNSNDGNWRDMAGNIT